MKHDRLQRAIARAQELATGADDWLEIGEASLDAGLDESFVRNAVERAEVLATDDDIKSSVSIAYALWLNDKESAARLGPRGIRPPRRCARA